MQAVPLAGDAVAVGIGRAELGHGVPAAHVAPLALEGHHGHVVVRLHHGVVDALRAAGQEGFGSRAHEAHRAVAAAHGLHARAGHGRLAGLQDVGRMLFERGQQHAGAGEEDAGVPQHVALQQQRLCRSGRGLFDEAGHAVAAVGAVGALLDVAVGAARKTGHHAVGDDGAGQCGGHALADGLGKRCGVGNVVVGRAEQQQRVLPVLAGQQGGQRHGRGRVAPGGLQQHLAAGVAAAQRIGHQKAVVLGRHTHHRLATPGQAAKRELQQALVAHQGHELLGKALAAQRPQAGAGATAEDDRGDGGVGCHGKSFAVGSGG